MSGADPSFTAWKRRLALNITLLGMIAVLPLIASAAFFLSTYAGREIAFADRERAGISCLRPLMHVLTLTPEHRLLLLDLVGNKAPAPPDLARIEAEADRCLAEFAKASRRLDRSESTARTRGIAEIAASLQRDWAALERSQTALSPEQIVARHLDFMRATEAAMETVGDSSNLILDPQLATYDLADAIVESLPMAAVKLSAATGDAALLRQRPTIGLAERIRLAALVTDFREFTVDRISALRSAVAPGAGTGSGAAALNRSIADVAASADRFLAARESFVAGLEQILASTHPDAMAQPMVQNGAVARLAAFHLWESAAGQLDLLLAQRLAGLRANRRVSLLFIFLAIASSIAMTVVVGRTLYNRAMAQRRADAEIRQLNSELEVRIAERTAQLQKFAHAIEQSPVSVVITNYSGAIEFVNPHFCAVTGYARDELICRSIDQVLKSGRHPEEFYAGLWRTIRSGQIWHGEVCDRRKNGELFWQQTSIAPLRDSTGAMTHFIAVMEDVTERIRAEEALRAAKADAEAASRSKSVFLANMSHEIRTPMNAILGFAQLMLRDQAATPQQQQHLATIGRNGEHLMQLINDILEMSKIEANRVVFNRSTFDPRLVARDLESMFRARAEAKGLTFAITCDASVPARAVADEAKLRQILINLVGNAVKFTERGSVTLTLSAEPIEHNGWLLDAAVADTGPGIPKTEQARLFQPFEQTAVGRQSGTGTGLGLAISREFARMMDGDITLESEEGKGTVFHVEIVLHRPENEMAVAVEGAADPRVRRLAPGLGTKRVLVVDDLEDNRRFLCQLLANAGFDTAEARNGSEAIVSFATWRPDAILMDMRMPVMDGAEAIRAIRSREPAPRVRIIMLSASVFVANREQAIAVGADDFLGKPFREADLFQKLGRLLDLTYEYADGARVGNRAVKAPVPAASAETEVVPAEFAAPLRRALEDADLDQMLALIDRLDASHPALARELRDLAQRFDYQQLLSRLES
jgi:PAS domain S-box-containing protein